MISQMLSWKALLAQVRLCVCFAHHLLGCKMNERNGQPKKAQDPDYQGGPSPKIIYTSRTHSQLAQVQQELNHCAYKPKSVVIASRDHLCVNTQVNKNRGAALNAACGKAK